MATQQELEFLLSVRDQMSAALKTAAESMGGLGAATTTAASQANVANDVFRGLSVGLGQFTAATAAFVAGQKIAQGLKEAVGASVDFQASMQKIVALVGVSQAQVDSWGQKILQLAPTLGQSPKALADALFFITSSGIQGSKAIDALVASAQGASAGLGDVKTVADVAHSAMNAYGQSNLSASDAVGTMVAAVREGKVEADQLAGALGKVLPVAAAAGVSFQDLTAAIAAMTRTGSSAPQAATAINNFLLHTLSAGPQALKVMKEIGISHRELLDELQKGGIEGAMGMVASKANLDQMRQLIQDQRALAAILSITGQNADQVSQIFARMRSNGGAGAGDLEKAFSVASQTNAFKFANAMSLVQVGMIKLGDEITPALVGALASLTHVWNTFFDGSAQAANNLEKLKVGFIGLSAAIAATVVMMNAGAIGTALTTLGAMGGTALDILAGKFVILDGFIIETQFAVIALDGLLAASGVGLVALAVGAAAVGFYELTKAVTASAGAMADKARVDAQILDIDGRLKQMTADQIAAAIAQEKQAYANEAANLAQAKAALVAAEAEHAKSDAYLRDPNYAPVSRQGLATGLAISAHDDRTVAQMRADSDVTAKNMEHIQATITALQMAKPYVPVTPILPPPIGNNEGAGAHSKKDMVQAEIDALTVEAAKYRDTGEAADYLSAIKKAGLSVQKAGLSVQNDEINSIDKALALTDHQSAAYRIASAAVEKYTAEIQANHVVVMQQIAAGAQISDLFSKDTRTREINTAVINAQTEAVKKHYTADQTAQAVADASAAAAAKFDDAVKQGSLAQERATQTAQAYAQAYVAAAGLTDRARAIETAGLKAYSAAIDADAQAQYNGIAAQKWNDAATAAGIEWDQKRAESIAEANKKTQDQIIALTALKGIRAKDILDLQSQTAYQNAYNAAIAAGESDMQAIAEATQKAALATQLYSADASHLVTIRDAISELNKEALNITPGTLFKNAWTSAFDAVGNAAEQFFMGQSVGWRQMAAQILAHIAAMIIQMLVMKAVMAALNFFGFAQGGVPGGVDAPTTMAANGMIVPNAVGNAYTNSIVDSPTLFKFANGSKMGVMGEAGPEAIVPLSRMRDGKLGVQMSGGGGAPSTNVSVHAPIVVNYQGSGNKDVDATAIDKMTAMMGAAVEGKINEVLARHLKQGGYMNPAFARTY